tara:strand:- start:21692 stop:21982 length:291 start_codon:yes stop_codon:yes gene_type:complete
METHNSNAERYQKAKQRVEKMKGFYTHLVIYLIFSAFFIFLNFRSGNFPWAIFPIVGWGLGIMGHATATFGWNPFFGRQWEERKIKEIMEKDRQLF